MEPEFTLFPQLATELRLQIWDLVAHQVRDVKVAITIEKGNPVSKPKAPDKIPGLLHTTSESRQVGLGIYVKILTKSSLSCIYLNPAIDILCVRFDDYHPYGFLGDVFREYVKDTAKYRKWEVMFAYGTFKEIEMVERCGFMFVKVGAVVEDFTEEKRSDAAAVVLKRTGWLKGSEDYNTPWSRRYKWRSTN